MQRESRPYVRIGVRETAQQEGHSRGLLVGRRLVRVVVVLVVVVLVVVVLVVLVVLVVVVLVVLVVVLVNRHRGGGSSSVTPAATGSTDHQYTGAKDGSDG